ncbi:MAG TPA: OstA-like protein [Candidatus Kapabacteria bacterium]|nr:OstA-like protein [Candidatus Kapabacteria bacterium]
MFKPLHRVLLALLTAALLCCAARPLQAQPVGPTQPVTLEHADTFNGYPDPGTGESVVDMQGHVVLLQGVVRIEADRAVMYQTRNYAVLTGNVRVTQPDMVLTAPRAEYDGNARLATAPNGVTIVDKDATIRAGSGDYNMYDRKARLRNGVVLQDEKSTLHAASGDYYSLDRKAVFTGGVRAENDSGTITSRDLTYWRDTKEAYAVGRVVVKNRNQMSSIASDTLHYQPAQGYTLALGSPKLVQIDTSRMADSAGTIRRDTTIITALRMEAFRQGREEYIATDSVRLVRGDLQAVAARARYLPDDSVISLGPARNPPSDTVHAGGDSTHAGADSSHAHAEGIHPGTDTAKGRRDLRDTTRRDTSARNADTLHGTPNDAVTGVRGLPSHGPSPIVWYQKSQLTGDTVTVHLQEKKLHMIDVQGSAFAISEGKRPARYDQLAGNRLLFNVQEDTIRWVRAEALASSIYYLYDNDAPNGVNRASADTITVMFEEGQASTIEFLGHSVRAEGEYFPEKMVKGQEATFRLEGFRWFGRDGSLAALNATLPKAPAVQDVRPPQGTGEHGATSRPRR